MGSKGQKILENTIGIGASIAGNLSVTALTNLAIPYSSIIGCVAGPVLTTITEDLAHRMLSKLEQDRLAFVEEYIVRKIEQRLKCGELPRCDDFYAPLDEAGQSSASKLLEATLFKCKQEVEEKKLKPLGNFWANMCFENTVSCESANNILTQFSALTYQQIKVLKYLNKDNIINIGDWEREMFSNDILAPYYIFYSDCLHLYNIRLASQSDTTCGVRLGTPNICISPSGKLMCRLMELEADDQELIEMSALVNNISAIVSRLKKEREESVSA